MECSDVGMRNYYKHIFPAKLMHRWLSYGSDELFCRREICFTLPGDVYLRYRSYATSVEFHNDCVSKLPAKIDIGAVFDYQPKEHKSRPQMQPVERELVFDIDLTDYDDVRKCCQGGNMCSKCWTFMIIAAKIINRILKALESFGFQHLLWVYSGRRGIHCWVCDKKARSLSSSARAAVAEYIDILKSGQSKKRVHIAKYDEKTGEVTLTTPHPVVADALGVVNDHFDALLAEQGFLETEEDWRSICDMLPTVIVHGRNADAEQVAEFYKGKYDVMDPDATSLQKWRTLTKSLKEKFGEKGDCFIDEIMLQLTYPRLDINVSKGLNHLLKSPFSVHPKTGKISIPISIDSVDSFDFDSVPTLPLLNTELMHQTGESTSSSLDPYVELFQKFIEQLPQETGDSLRSIGNVAK